MANKGKTGRPPIDEVGEGDVATRRPPRGQRARARSTTVDKRRAGGDEGGLIQAGLAAALSKVSGQLQTVKENDVEEIVDATDAQPKTVRECSRSIVVGTTAYALSGDAMIRKERERFYAHPAQTNLDPEAPLGISRKAGPPLAWGINVILALGDVGKSPVLKHIARRTGAPLLRFGEPLPGYAREDHELARGILTFLDGIEPDDEHGHVLAIDSLKQLIGRVPGTTMKVGISREFVSMLSDWSSFFAECRVAAVIVLNVSTKDAAAVSEVEEGLKSNCSGVWVYDETGLSWTVRRGEGLKRLRGSGRVVWKSDGVVDELVVTMENAVDDLGYTGPVTTSESSVDAGLTTLDNSRVMSSLSRVMRTRLPDHTENIRNQADLDER